MFQFDKNHENFHGSSWDLEYFQGSWGSSKVNLRLRKYSWINLGLEKNFKDQARIDLLRWTDQKP